MTLNLQTKYLFPLLICFAGLWAACQTTEPTPKEEPEEKEEVDSSFYRGADLSYVNEMLDCGGSYKNDAGEVTDPYQLFQQFGANLIRFRLWHNSDWTTYSQFEDVKQGIRRAKLEGMEVLLDFHYSDDWADPNKQEVPKAWEGVVNDTGVLGDSVYQYTHRVLTALKAENLLPEMVQVGNEINIEILQKPDSTYSQINWSRNASLLKKGIQAVRDIASQHQEDIQVMLHIAQPENALWWFEEADEAGIRDYDWIGLSYYPKWSTYSLAGLPDAIQTLISSYQKKVMIVETAYPYTLDNLDAANNILGTDALIPGYPATQQGQADFLTDLISQVKKGNGQGVVYWEPAWISTPCSTRWGKGSHWDNATFFDKDGTPTMGINMFNE